MKAQILINSIVTLSFLSPNPVIAGGCQTEALFAQSLFWAESLIDACIAKEEIDDRYGFCAQAGACAKLNRVIKEDSKLAIDLKLDNEEVIATDSPGNLGLSVQYSFERSVETSEECYSLHQAFADNLSLLISTVCKTGVDFE